MNKPNLFIVGAPKAGTTTIYYLLKKHPNIFFPDLKEPNYFSSKNSEFLSLPGTKYIKVVKNQKDYLNLYKNIPDNSDWIGDASTSYLHYADPNDIKTFCSSDKVKIIILIRNPIDRALSHYFMAVKKCYIPPLSFEESINKFPFLLKFSMYSDCIEKYIETFENNNVTIIVFEDLKKSTHYVIDKIASDLSIKKDKFNLTKKHYNKGTYPKNKIIANITFLIRRLGISSKLKRIPLINSLYQNFFLAEISKEIKKKHLPQEVELSLKEIFIKDTEKLSTLTGKNLVEVWFREI